MGDPTNTDLAIQIATLSGKLDGFAMAQQVRDVAITARLDESAADRHGLHTELDRVNAWQNKVTGGLIALAAVQSLADVAAGIWVALTHH